MEVQGREEGKANGTTNQPEMRGRGGRGQDRRWRGGRWNKKLRIWLKMRPGEERRASHLQGG